MASTIILSDNGVSSGSAGLKETGGNDGVLILQTTTSGGAATNAVYIDNIQNASFGSAAPVADSGWKNITFQGTQGAQLWFQDSTGTGTYTTSQGFIGSDSDSMNMIAYGASRYIVFSTNNTERMRINAGAPVLCLAGGNSSATGTGIAFPATQSASTDANTLDDYEEGYWTPVVYGTTTAGTCTYGSQLGRYIKIGKMVTISCAISYTSHTGTGSIGISGLPYVSINVSPYESVTVVGDGNLSPPAGRAASFYVGANQSILNGYTVTTGGSAGGAPLALPATGSAWFNVTYEAAA